MRRRWRCRRAKARPTRPRPPRSGPAASAARWAWRRPPAIANLRIHADGGEARAAVLELIAGATRTIDVCTFILATDGLGDEIAQALRSQAERGVKVRLLIDGIGAWLGGRLDMKALSRSGVQVVKFVPPFLSILRGRANLRNHRKMIVVDAERLWCGGRNFAAEYFEGDPAKLAGRSLRNHAWHDLSFDLRGELVVHACELFEKDWAYATRTPVAVAPCPAPQVIAASDAPLAQLVPSGPEQVDDTVQSLLVSGCFMARRRVLVVTPYFIPDATLLMALTLAARRGVLIDIVLPRRSNHRLADVARHRPLRDLAAAGARLWFEPYMQHAKAVVVDDQLALVGSANLDLRSLFLNYELMVAFYEPADVRRFAAWIEHERGLASRFEPKEPGLVRDLLGGPAALARVPALALAAQTCR